MNVRGAHPAPATSRRVLALALPMTVANVTTPLLGFVGAAVIGRLGDAALLGAMALGAVIFDAIFWSFGSLRMATAGLTRAVLAFLLEAYDEDEAPNTKGGVDKRTVMRFDPRLAPVKVAVLPLSRNPELSPKAKELSALLRKRWTVEFDDSQAIGRRYRRQDEIGTPFCVTVDFDTLTDNAVTVRDRDTMKQERVSLDQIEDYLIKRLPGC